MIFDTFYVHEHFPKLWWKWCKKPSKKKLFLRKPFTIAYHIGNGIGKDEEKISSSFFLRPLYHPTYPTISRDQIDILWTWSVAAVRRCLSQTHTHIGTQILPLWSCHSKPSPLYCYDDFLPDKRTNRKERPSTGGRVCHFLIILLA